MKMYRISSQGLVAFILACGSLLLSGRVCSAQLQGLVNMDGAILETPCDIAIGDTNQSLRMEAVALSQLIEQGYGPEQPFAIRLVHCVLPKVEVDSAVQRRFTVTFDGDRDLGYFGVTGSARGVALMIRDRQGSVAVPGRPLPSVVLQADDMTLDYTMALVANQDAPRAGDYRSSIRFQVDYY
ncbi:fimbrial protein [Aeromonas hydrophila]|uniref:fimbrial protein n=1 Tax=Aeromonas hydrophila TaxID=644 RepID=UPI000953A150|nr:fimbrial protein [Aeromonas hydrophila]SIR20544.1 Pilin (type 1 fimbria component protein) [Aeromonas hydrophila]SIR36804.1 Pilin (type 1 fimbria component protein) [Aeromonas hydrophila]